MTDKEKSNVVSFKEKQEQRQKELQEEMPMPIINMDIADFVALPHQEQFNYLVRMFSRENQELRAGYEMCPTEEMLLLPCPVHALYAPTEEYRMMYNWVLMQEGRPESDLLTPAIWFPWAEYIVASSHSPNSAPFAMYMLFVHDHENIREWKSILKEYGTSANFDTSLIDTLPWFDNSPEEIMKFIEEKSKSSV